MRKHEDGRFRGIPECCYISQYPGLQSPRSRIGDGLQVREFGEYSARIGPGFPHGGATLGGAQSGQGDAEILVQRTAFLEARTQQRADACAETCRR